MKYFNIIIIFLLFSCVPIEKNPDILFEQSFGNTGFTLIHSKKLFDNKTVSKMLDERSLVIFQRNLKLNTNVKITNIINNKSIVAKVGNSAEYPSFYNSVISIRIAKELEINVNEPYIKIEELNKNSSFIANKAKIFEEEKNVAVKAPVDEIGIKDLSIKEVTLVKTKKNNFSYVIKIADFYFYKTAQMLKVRISKELNMKNIKINELSKTQFRVYLGPYDNLKSLQNAFNKIKLLDFENIEMIKV
tara:strand:+ start:325 stop:1062 length:738 start_codon:yes stop_codon:yes gene_type:complete